MFHGRMIVCDEPEQIKRLVEGELVELRPVDATGGEAGATVAAASLGRNLRRAQQALAPLDSVLEVQTYDDLLHVFVDDAGRRQAALVAALGAQGLAAVDVCFTRPRMEEAFISLVSRQVAAREMAACDLAAREMAAGERADG